VESALRIQCRVDRKFYRAAAAFRAVAHLSKHRQHAGIITIIAVAEVERLEVMRYEDPARTRQGNPKKNIYVGNLDLKTTAESTSAPSSNHLESFTRSN
jgi:hypothetical protein